MSDRVEIYVHGACSGNPGEGGWGALLLYGKTHKKLYGGEAETTNHRMYLVASIKALEELDDPCEARIHTNSAYLHDGITKWIDGWNTNGWRTSGNKQVKNADLWRRLQELSEKHQVEWALERGKSPYNRNERADANSLARKGMAKFLPHWSSI